MFVSYPTYYYLKVENDDLGNTDSFNNYSQEYLPKEILEGSREEYEFEFGNEKRYEDYKNDFDKIDEEFIKLCLG